MICSRMQRDHDYVCNDGLSGQFQKGHSKWNCPERYGQRWAYKRTDIWIFEYSRHTNTHGQCDTLRWQTTTIISKWLHDTHIGLYKIYKNNVPHQPHHYQYVQHRCICTVLCILVCIVYSSVKTRNRIKTSRKKNNWIFLYFIFYFAWFPSGECWAWWGGCLDMSCIKLFEFTWICDFFLFCLKRSTDANRFWLCVERERTVCGCLCIRPYAYVRVCVCG